ncbi:hypothetical protein [Acinetobacter venetianus]|uniref:hypothetical protein n=1 Tax=Acinetobacter venetianus TaxID=52133 RepID=UPI003F8F13E8|nr:hypothetical protein [Pseudomonadota bacterium]MDA1255149.1 hypothetical protein [Pseudomonadota bacterium]
MIKKILATLMSCLVLVALIVIFYWRDTQYQPESADLINYFIFLPIVITVVLLSPWFVYSVYQHRKKKKQQALSQQDEGSDQKVDAEQVNQPSQWIALNVFAASAYHSFGENDAIVEGIKQFTSAQLDTALLNFQGLPILSYRVADLDQQLEHDGESEQAFLSIRQQRITALLQHQIEQNTEFLMRVSQHLKASSLFYESQNLYEYRMHPAWTDPTHDSEEDLEPQQVQQVYRIDKLNLHILLSEDLLHTWNEHDCNEYIQTIFYDLEIIPQKLHIEYHFVSSASSDQYLLELFDRIQKQPHEISWLIAVDSEIDQEVIDEKSWNTNAYIPAEFINSCFVAHPSLEIEQSQPVKTLRLVAHQNNLNQIFKELDIHDLPQYQDEAPFVFVAEDGSDIKVVKRLEQFFGQSSVEQHHYLYCKPAVGNTLNVAKVFAVLLAAQLSDQYVAFVYSQDLKAFFQTFPEVSADQESVAIAD